MGAKDKNTTIDPELQKIQEQERARIASEAAAAKAQRTTLDNQEIADLTAAQTAQTQALKDNNETLYKNQGEIIKAAEEKWNAAKQKDETARRRENAFRYISGLGDTLSGVANLIGTAHGASNQNQKYNSHAVVQKAEEARKARKLDIESQSKRLDELSAQLQNLKAAGSLKEAELAAAQMKEMAALKKGQRTAGEAEDKYYSKKADDAVTSVNNLWLKQSANELKEDELDYKKTKPNNNSKPSSPKPKIIKIQGDDKSLEDFDVSSFKDFEKDYQRALDAAIKAGTSGLTPEEIQQYEAAVTEASLGRYDGDGGASLREFFRTHTPRKSIVDKMQSGANNPKYQ